MISSAGMSTLPVGKVQSLAICVRACDALGLSRRSIGAAHRRISRRSRGSVSPDSQAMACVPEPLDMDACRTGFGPRMPLAGSVPALHHDVPFPAQDTLSVPESSDASIRSYARNPGIDILRGLSILLVVLHHFDLRVPLKDSAVADVVSRRVLGALTHNGYEAVFVFFVISGFLIASHSIRRWGNLGRIDLAAFCTRRAARILPCLVALVGVLALLHLAGAGDYRIGREGQSLTGAVVAVFGLHLNWYEGATGYLPGNWDVLWSLSVEEAFYLGFPLLCLALRSERLLIALLLPLALSLPISLQAITGNEIWKEKAYLPGIAAIAAGVLVAIAVARLRRPHPYLVRALGAVGVVGLLAVTFAMRELWPVLHDGVMLLLTASSACLVAALAWAPAARAPRGSGGLIALGRLSYEIYLTHMFVVYSLVALLRACDGDPRRGWLWYLPLVGLTWLLGALVARLWSQPCERAWLRRAQARARPAVLPHCPARGSE
jgi:peptidoglycan/LPS O-acetylase OafA/YrhL